jgi:hypothetical protein
MEVTPSEEQWAKAVKLCCYLSGQYNIPIGKIKGHRDFRNTLCPGDKFDIVKFREAVIKEAEDGRD